MQRARPTDLRKSLLMADALVKAGIMFIPMPVLSGEDLESLVVQMNNRLDQLAREAEDAC